MPPPAAEMRAKRVTRCPSCFRVGDRKFAEIHFSPLSYRRRNVCERSLKWEESVGRISFVVQTSGQLTLKMLSYRVPPAQENPDLLRSPGRSRSRFQEGRPPNSGSYIMIQHVLSIALPISCLILLANGFKCGSRRINSQADRPAVLHFRFFCFSGSFLACVRLKGNLERGNGFARGIRRWNSPVSWRSS